MQNGPPVSKVDHTGFCFYLICELFKQTFVIGLGDVTSLHIAHTKPTVVKISENQLLTTGDPRARFFLWLIQILKAVAMVVVAAIALFWLFK
jgi:hypothetical protein